MRSNANVGAQGPTARFFVQPRIDIKVSKALEKGNFK